MLNNRRGFTLLETTLVLALTVGSGLLVIGFFSGLRSQAQFSDAVDTVKNELLARRQETLTTIKTAGGVQKTYISIGRLLTFTPGSSKVKVGSLFMNDEGSSTVRVEPSSGSTFVDTSDITIPWGTVYPAACPRTLLVAFIRNPANGSLMTAGTNAASNWNYNVAARTLDYTSMTSGSSLAANLRIPMMMGRQRGYVNVEAATSSVTVQMLGTTGSLSCP